MARLALLQTPARAARVALVLWVVLAVLVWNDVFDQVIITAGRHYLFAAFASAKTGGPYLRIADAMRPALARAFWTATAAGLPILVFGFVAVRLAGRAAGPDHP